ncbi:NO signaling/Golgi transport ligand-binding domain-containing protein [Dunaliella salina]|uniref:Trafficking protein particle complex subunit n=1 Tax=Dunaliella salina TaxID=3046 RepID=A0ABQ7GPC7_DUNSA|nr:NO signaling/Golgi transport ligand-binding domain-containing protein [Dunaliella salina]|eukprot:KAF5836460.1 NO signaling/Golgi transport ligand-binding domain-containing protein [Dunaliella salina]
MHKTLCRGYNIGIRLIDEFLAKSKVSRCGSFRETVDIIAKQAFLMFLNMQCTVSKWTQDGSECSLIFTDNPLTEFVELPSEFQELQYCNILCGVIRGALEMINMDVDVRIVGDMLKGDEVHEMRLRLKEQKNEDFPYKDDE